MSIKYFCDYCGREALDGLRKIERTDKGFCSYHCEFEWIDKQNKKILERSENLSGATIKIVYSSAEKIWKVTSGLHEIEDRLINRALRDLGEYFNYLILREDD